MVLVSPLNGMGVVVLFLVFELFVVMEVLLFLLFGNMDNQLLVGLVPELMFGLVSVLDDVELVSQLALRLV